MSVGDNKENYMRFLKAFIAGLVFPAVLLPIQLFLWYAYGDTVLLSQPILLLLPIAWGLWNVLYFAVFKYILPFGMNEKLIVTGFVLGLLLAIYGVFVLNLPGLVGVPSYLRFLPLILAPIIYAVIWRYVVKFLNEVVGLEN